MSAVLDDLDVLDFSRVLAGPFATMLLGDLGARVTKIERPGTGDDTRSWGPPHDVCGQATYFDAVNRNKSSLALDLSDPAHRQRAYDLALAADVLVENFRPGVMDRLGLGWEELEVANPRLIYCSITGFGRQGGAALPGYDLLVQALGGLMSVTGSPDGEPQKVGVALVDVITGLFATVGILSALRHRDATGHGQRVEVDLLSSLLAALVNQASAFTAAGVVPQRMGNAHPSIAPYELYPCASGDLVLAVGNDRQFAALAAVLGASELADDERFATNPQRVAHRTALRAELIERLAARSAREWATELTAARVPAGVVNDISQAFALAHELGLDPLVSLPLDDGQELRLPRNPIALSRTPPAYRAAPPSLPDSGPPDRPRESTRRLPHARMGPGMDTAFWHPFADMAEVRRHAFTVVRGDGVHVFDAHNRPYLDAIAGLWYCHIGHGRPEIAAAVAGQMERLECYATFGDVTNEPAERLSGRLAALSDMPDTRVFLTLGGGDGVEAAAKLARMYWAQRGKPEKTHLIGRSFAYHGTHGFGTSLAGMDPIRQGFGPLTGDVSHVPYDSLEALEAEVRRLGAGKVAAFFCEPVIGAGGVRPVPPGYLEALSEVCHRHEILLVIDGVICAFGRLGTWFGYERWGVEPDMVVVAKGLTSGYLPLGAVLVSGRVAEPFWAEPGHVMVRHGATYAGHPTCCAAALANLDVLEGEGLIARGRELEGDLWRVLAPLGEHPACGEVRGGVGLMGAVELAAELTSRDPHAAHHFYEAIRDAGVIVRAQATGVAVGPPLTVTSEQLSEIGDAIAVGLDAVSAGRRAPTPA